MSTRLDLVLSYLCLSQSRSSARRLCDSGLVLVNGSPARAATRMKVGDRVTILRETSADTVELIDVPERQVSRSKSPYYYRRLPTPPEEIPADNGDPPEGW